MRETTMSTKMKGHIKRWTVKRESAGAGHHQRGEDARGG